MLFDFAENQIKRHLVVLYVANIFVVKEVYVHIKVVIIDEIPMKKLLNVKNAAICLKTQRLWLYTTTDFIERHFKETI